MYNVLFNYYHYACASDKIFMTRTADFQLRIEQKLPVQVPI